MKIEELICRSMAKQIICNLEIHLALFWKKVSVKLPCIFYLISVLSPI